MDYISVFASVVVALTGAVVALNDLKKQLNILTFDFKECVMIVMND